MLTVKRVGRVPLAQDLDGQRAANKWLFLFLNLPHRADDAGYAAVGAAHQRTAIFNRAEHRIRHVHG